MKKFLTTFIFLIIFQITMGQHVSVGIEGGVAFDRYKFNNTSNFSNINEVSGMGGLAVRLSTRSRFSFEFAALFKEYYLGFQMHQQRARLASSSDEVYFFPLRAIYNLNITKRLSISPVIGIAPVFKLLPDDMAGGYFEGTTGYLYEPRTASTKNIFFLLQTGAGFEYVAGQRIRFSIRANYYHGLMNINEWDLSYTIDAQNFQTAEMISKGSFINYTGGIQYIFRR